MENKTIAAISTPLGTGGISIIRMSGKQSLAVLSKIFSCKTNVSEFEPRRMYLGEVSTEYFKDKGMAVYFAAPYSYTGEDIVEIHCHGGVKIAEGVLKELLKHGAHLAEAGEFTKRAFLNGKVSLDEAEGVIDLITSESDSQIRAGYNLVAGKLKNKITEIQEKITEMLAKIEVSLDYPEEDLEEETTLDINKELQSVEEQLLNLYKTSSTGQVIKNGCRLVIVGKTNVGKSSLMNALLNYNRAIVTDIQGTTRDILEENFEYKGVKFILIDTAGIRESEDQVEQIGIERAKSALEYGDIIIYVLDGTRPLDSDDIEMMQSLAGRKVICVVNKSDLSQKIDTTKLKNAFTHVLEVSALEEKGIENIKQLAYDMVIDGDIAENALILTNIRHINIISESLQLIKNVKQALENNVSLDLLSLDIKAVWLKLGEITGTTDIEAIVDMVFSKFCVGK